MTVYMPTVYTIISIIDNMITIMITLCAPEIREEGERSASETV